MRSPHRAPGPRITPTLGLHSPADECSEELVEAALEIDGRIVTLDEGLAGEYPRLYQRFAALCDAEISEVDWRPFQLVADAFLIGERRIVAPHEI